ncbi:hypothetical protein ACTU45_10410 [Streptomyces sp. 24-1644]
MPAASATVAVDVGLDGARHVRPTVTDTHGSETGAHGDRAEARSSRA